MITQQFRLLVRDHWSIFAFAVPFLLLFALSGCDEEGTPLPSEPARIPSTACSPACTGGLDCFEDLEGCADASCVGCYPRTCPAANPTQSCVDGAVCDENLGRCTFVQTCDPACGSGTHCVGGHCVRDYTPGNMCDPLDQCRRLCGANDASCLDACERDRSATCEICISTLRQCENRDACFGSATGCCSDDFCACFPGASGCGGRACDDCIEQCTTDGTTNTACFNQCANLSAACSTCLAPLTTDPTCSQTPTPPRCEALFNECVTN